ncbi:MAG TPA: hypothetical protein VIU93_14980 [Gallionellaceae bacterium]
MGAKLNVARGVDKSKVWILVWKATAAVVFAIILSRWTWVWLAPRAPSIPVAVEKSSPEDAERLFGVTAGASGQGMSLANVNLIGVFSGLHGFAIFQLDGARQVGVPIGGEVSPGVKLLEISGDYVIVGRDGVQQRVDLKDVALKH